MLDRQGGLSAFCICMFSICTGISLYFLISWLFWMGSHWWHWKAKSSLCALAVSNGGSICLWHLYVFYMHWYFLIFSYKLTVLNGLSLMTLKMEKFTLCSGSFKWAGLSAWALHLPNLNSWTFRCGSSIRSSHFAKTNEIAILDCYMSVAI